MELRGWRRYALTRIDNSWALKGMQCEWPSVQMTAECITDKLLAHLEEYGELPPPHIEDEDRHMACVSHLKELHGQHIGHGCGIYVIPEARDLHYVTNGFGLANVQCIAWGTIAEYEIGFRAEKVRMEHIILDPMRVEQYFATHRRKITAGEIDILERELGYRYGVYVTWAETPQEPLSAP